MARSTHCGTSASHGPYSARQSQSSLGALPAESSSRAPSLQGSSIPGSSGSYSGSRGLVQQRSQATTSAPIAPPPTHPARGGAQSAMGRPRGRGRLGGDQSFVLLMNGKHPQTILTDQDLGLIEAIANELPHFKHAFLLYELGNIEEFEHQWDGLISQFDLGSNRHIKLLYLNRASWALPYLKGYFFAGMVGTAVSIRNYAGEEATMRQKYYNSQIKTFMPMEKHESKVLTPFAFKLLQDAMILSVEYSLFPHSDGSYLVRHYSKTDGGRFVYWNSIEEVVQYSCQEFEFSKILCRLSIRVLSAHNYFMLPDKYFLARWRQENPLVLKFTHMMKSNNDNNELQSLHSTFRDFTLESIKTKGRLEYAKKELQRVRQIIQCFPENEHMKEEHEHVALVNL
uniref:Protein FAR1-RELATED SEQUENCE n=1 Tax=Nicotiana tabacum TaxID=4097 RepID=A0A1S3Z5X0_TOBAC|nr:PREDICTED: protein FAR1-RELATED SEQUENCE 11-like [Nicotiana tabacum]